MKKLKGTPVMACDLHAEDGNLYRGTQPIGHIRDREYADFLVKSVNQSHSLIFVVECALNDVPGWRANAVTLLHRIGIDVP